MKLENKKFHRENFIMIGFLSVNLILQLYKSIRICGDKVVSIFLVN